MDIDKKISKDCRERMKTEIDFAGGNEVFFRGIPDENMIVTDYEVLARGNEHSVPAILRHMKKEEVIIHNHPSGYLYPSDADVEIAALYSQKKKGASFIINNSVDNIYVIVELKKEEIKTIDIGPYFEEKGLLAQEFQGFEYRHEQFEMAKFIEKGINDSKKVVIEAGTGTGKTLAYLIPAIEWAKTNEKKVIISTNTINLQEQLLSKDIPLVKKVLQHEFSYALLKGRGNYACLKKNEQLQRGELVDTSELGDSQKFQLETIVKWIDTTKSGDKAELPFDVDNVVWEFFGSEADLCSPNNCPHREMCFFLKSREEKLKADVLISNHHLYFADLAIRKEVGFENEFSIFPNYDMVVFDEAHNIEKVARDYFSYEVSKYGFTKAMNNIYRVSRGSSKKMGSLQIFKNFLKNSVKNAKLSSEYTKRIDEEIIAKHNILFERTMDYFVKVIEVYCSEGVSVNVRLRPEELATNMRWQKELKPRQEELFTAYISYIKEVRKIIKEAKEYEDEHGAVRDFEKYVDRIDSFFLSFRFILDFADDNFIFWLSGNPKKNNIKLVATPLKIHNELDEVLYTNLDHIVFTSATIAINDDFDYFKKSIGLSEKVYEKAIHSPFNYDKQMKVYIPTDILLPNDRNFLDDIKDFLIGIIKMSKGNTFLLFTSYQQLNYTYYLIRDELEELNFDLFIQGMAPRNQLINMYKAANKPVLFGTDSFWEGVDVQGDKLSSVVLVKLPFKVPSDPVVEAIIENMEKEGKNPFMDYQIPESIIKFKQGIGRLIRSKEDKGVITILDARLYKKQYGRIFIEAIPTKNINFATRREILGRQ